MIEQRITQYGDRYHLRSMKGNRENDKARIENIWAFFSQHMKHFDEFLKITKSSERVLDWKEDSERVAEYKRKVRKAEKQAATDREAADRAARASGFQKEI